MKRAAVFISLIAFCFFFFSSCEKDGSTNVSYLEGKYTLQIAEGNIRFLEGYEYNWSYDDKARKLSHDAGESVVLSWLDSATNEKLMHKMIDELVCFPSGLTFRKDGTVLVKPLFCWLDDSGMEYWYEEEDKDDVEIQVNYTIEKGVIVFRLFGLRGYSYKIVSNSGNTLNLELTDEYLKEFNEGEKYTMTWSKARYQRH